MPCNWPPRSRGPIDGCLDGNSRASTHAFATRPVGGATFHPLIGIP